MLLLTPCRCSPPAFPALLPTSRCSGLSARLYEPILHSYTVPSLGSLATVIAAAVIATAVRASGGAKARADAKHGGGRRGSFKWPMSRQECEACLVAQGCKQDVHERMLGGALPSAVFTNDCTRTSNLQKCEAFEHRRQNCHMHTGGQVHLISYLGIRGCFQIGQLSAQVHPRLAAGCL